MKLTLKITYKGKSYKNFSDALEASVADGLVDVIRDRLKPFERELNAEGSIVSIDVDKKNGEIKASVGIQNISEELKAKVLAGLNKP